MRKIISIFILILSIFQTNTLFALEDISWLNIFYTNKNDSYKTYKKDISLSNWSVFVDTPYWFYNRVINNNLYYSSILQWMNIYSKNISTWVETKITWDQKIWYSYWSFAINSNSSKMYVTSGENSFLFFHDMNNNVRDIQLTNVEAQNPTLTTDWNFIIYTNINDWKTLYKRSVTDYSVNNGTKIVNVRALFPVVKWNYLYYVNIDKWLKIYKKDLNNANDFEWVAINNVRSYSPRLSPLGEYVIYSNLDDNWYIYIKNENDMNDWTKINNVTSINIEVQ